MDKKGALAMLGKVLLGGGVALAALFRDTLAAGLQQQEDAEQEDRDRQFYDSDLAGEYNYRAGRLDAGTDPYGWYDDD